MIDVLAKWVGEAGSCNGNVYLAGRTEGVEDK
jgi:hypothetical protein